MLRKETIEAGTLDLIIKLCSDEKLQAFNLVGGTALALKIGHRKSIDIDLFSTTPFDPHELCNHIIQKYQADPIKVIGPGVFGFINDIKIDLMPYSHQLVEKIELTEGVRMVSLLDIAAMKLNAIARSGTRLKDFIDIYHLLEHFSLQQMLSAFEKKYNTSHGPFINLALQHHADIDFSVPIDFIGDRKEWYIVATRLQKACRKPNLIFRPIHPGSTMKRLLKIDLKNRKGKRW